MPIKSQTIHYHEGLFDSSFSFTCEFLFRKAKKSRDYIYLALRGGLLVGLMAFSKFSAAITGSTVLLVVFPFWL